MYQSSRARAVAVWTCVAIGLLLLIARAAVAEERLLAFDVRLDVRADASLFVEETIRVEVEGNRFQRGILRDIPTVYRSADKSRYDIELKVESVSRDGRPEPFAVDRGAFANGVQLRIGDANVFLEHGPHTYVIRYSVRHVIGFFDAHDELYWNVTGTGWDFSIDNASAEVSLPGGAPILGYEAFTGPQGAVDKNFRAETMANGHLRFETTEKLGPREGLTIVAAWPKGYVAAPTEADKAARFFRQNLPVFIAALGFVGVFAYYVSMWLRVGVDPPAGTIIPRFSPPRGIGPAAARFVRRMGYDRKALTAALIDIAAKGVMRIGDDGKTFRLDKTSDDYAALTPGETALARHLFAGRRSIEMDNDNHAVFGALVNKLKSALEDEHARATFIRNQIYFWVGLALTLVVALASALSAPDRETVLVLTLVVTALTVVGTIFGLRSWRSLQIASSSFGGRILKLFRAAGTGLFFIVQFGFFLFISSLLADLVSFWTPALLAATAALNIVFFELLKAPTLAGRKLMDEIEGFRMYLRTAEAPRLENLAPPEMTPELFEKFLPYAIALDVENEWSERFEAAMRAAQIDPAADGHAYRPSFYSGSRLGRFSPGSFGSALGGAMSSAVASAATAPGSSSGMGGGGFSGGGGGGGGGGGW